jgi:hypothetical protein
MSLKLWALKATAGSEKQGLDYLTPLGRIRLFPRESRQASYGPYRIRFAGACIRIGSEVRTPECHD